MTRDLVFAPCAPTSSQSASVREAPALLVLVRPTSSPSHRMGWQRARAQWRCARARGPRGEDRAAMRTANAEQHDCDMPAVCEVLCVHARGRSRPPRTGSSDQRRRCGRTGMPRSARCVSRSQRPPLRVRHRWASGHREHCALASTRADELTSYAS